MKLMHKMGMKVVIIAPEFLRPEKFPIPDTDVTVFDSMEDGLKNCDAIMMLRNQKERMQVGLIKSDAEFFENYGLTKERLNIAKENAVVLHPGPMNRNVEISDAVADDPHASFILKQVENGVFTRMAILDLLINGTS
jgi:aspartate carbamoyltransferase catalytic subunit